MRPCASHAEYALRDRLRMTAWQGVTRGRNIWNAQAMFEAVGRVVVVDEKQIDAVTGLSASGTAFIYYSRITRRRCVKVGLPRDISTLLAADHDGAARMVLDTGDHPALLKDAVTTPQGHDDGILELEDGKVRVTLMRRS